ncbi:hypothetical protein X975_01563, partial [Stegodyphus mimosarum]
MRFFHILINSLTLKNIIMTYANADQFLNRNEMVTIAKFSSIKKKHSIIIDGLCPCLTISLSPSSSLLLPSSVLLLGYGLHQEHGPTECTFLTPFSTVTPPSLDQPPTHPNTDTESFFEPGILVHSDDYVQVWPSCRSSKTFFQAYGLFELLSDPPCLDSLKTTGLAHQNATEQVNYAFY